MREPRDAPASVDSVVDVSRLLTCKLTSWATSAKPAIELSLTT